MFRMDIEILILSYIYSNFFIYVCEFYNHFGLIWHHFTSISFNFTSISSNPSSISSNFTSITSFYLHWDNAPTALHRSVYICHTFLWKGPTQLWAKILEYLTNYISLNCPAVCVFFSSRGISTWYFSWEFNCWVQYMNRL